MSGYKRIITLLLAACSLQHVAYGQPVAPQRWQQQVDFLIDASLQEEGHTLDGFVKMVCHNNSPDTLSFLWIHLWPNACKNDQTAFSEQLLANGRTDFYFSDKGQRGYINRLDFRVEGAVAKMEDHPRYIDIIKILLPRPLLPGAEMTITTPFHVQLPYPFSGTGYNKGTYLVTRWFPQPAVYDQKGWHEMPYLDQGGSYNEYGNFDVRITLPKNYTVAATGALTSTSFMPSSGPSVNKPHDEAYLLAHSSRASSRPISNAPAGTQTLRFQQKNISGFAWFASRYYQTDHDTLMLPSGRVIDVYTCYTPQAAPLWQNSIAYIKRAVRFRSSLIGEYPYDVISVAEIPAITGSTQTSSATSAPGSSSSGLSSSASFSPRPSASASASYPTLAGILTPATGQALDQAIQHTIGYNWFRAILGADERTNTWMTEGLNTYYDRRYAALKYPSLPTSHSRKPTPPASHRNTARKNPSPSSHNTSTHHIPNWIKKKLSDDPDRQLVNTLAATRQDQPVSTHADDFTLLNYHLIARTKTACWLQQLEDSLGAGLFDTCMQEYFRQWSFRHPTPADFHTVMENTASRNLDAFFALLDEKGPVTPFQHPKKIRPTFLFSERNTDKINYINFAPAAGYNSYDHFMIGALIHNFNRPPSAFQFVLAPLYATNSHQFTGAGYLQYSWFPGSQHQHGHATQPLNTSQPASSIPSTSPIQKITAALEAAKFSSFSGADSNGHPLSGGFYKLAPSLRLTWKNATTRSSMQKWVEWKTYLIGEQAFAGYVQKSTDSLSYPSGIGKYRFRYLNQFSANIEDNRVLYPYKALLQFQQGDRFYRINFTGNYFFNYAEGGGMDLRFFAAKFGYIGSQASSLDLSTYQPKLTGVSGAEDYTYSNYFVGRNDYTGLASQQIMIRDGGLKIRAPNFPWLEGRSDNWVSALNLSSTLPAAIMPRWLPLKIFLDIGTYADAWQPNSLTSKFLYTGGLQLSLFHNALNVYAPLLYSSDFSSQLKTIPDQNTFWKKLSFSIELQNLFGRRNSPGKIAGAGGTLTDHSNTY